MVDVDKGQKLMNDYSVPPKKILLIAPVFFGYYKDIINELESLDYDVTYICDAPSNSNFSKALGRVNKNLIKRSTERYFKRNVIPTIQKDDYDYVLLVAGMTFAFTPDMICSIKEMNPKAKFVMYQWDSERNLPYSVHIHRYFDSIYSFDRTDCCNRNYYKFLPLFYTRIYEDIGKDVVHHFEFDCSYVGTAHPKKYCDVNCMAERKESPLGDCFMAAPDDDEDEDRDEEQNVKKEEIKEKKMEEKKVEFSNKELILTQDIFDGFWNLNEQTKLLIEKEKDIYDKIENILKEKKIEKEEVKMTLLVLYYLNTNDSINKVEYMLIIKKATTYLEENGIKFEEIFSQLKN